MILLSHPTGNANVRHAALGLHRGGLLGEFWTCVNYRDASGIGRLLPASVSSQLKRRTFPAELAGCVRTHPWRELGRLFASRFKANALVRHERGLCSVDAVYQSLDRKVASTLRHGSFSGIYAYEDGAESAFLEAGRQGLKKFYDQPIGHWRAARTLLTEEAQREPEWAVTLLGNVDSPFKTARKDAELAMADVVFAASSFTRQTLEQTGTLKAPVIVIPYGAPSLPAEFDRASTEQTGKTLRVLFVGGLSQRKGLSYLFAAARALSGAIELTIIGSKPPVECAVLDRNLSRVRWIPSCPHETILAEMAAHDVFVFPSLFEGFGLVLLEAMAMGLPIITTPHTAGPDLIRDGVEGFIVPIRSTEAIVNRLEQLRREPERRREMSTRARLRSRGFTWENYETRLAAAVCDALSPT